jgi:hypothetical protein
MAQGQFTALSVLKIAAYLSGLLVEVLIFLLPSETLTIIETVTGLNNLALAKWILRAIAFIIGAGLVIATALFFKQHILPWIKKRVQPQPTAPIPPLVEPQEPALISLGKGASLEKATVEESEIEGVGILKTDEEAKVGTLNVIKNKIKGLRISNLHEEKTPSEAQAPKEEGTDSGKRGDSKEE